MMGNWRGKPLRMWMYTQKGTLDWAIFAKYCFGFNKCWKHKFEEIWRLPIKGNTLKMFLSVFFGLAQQVRTLQNKTQNVTFLGKKSLTEFSSRDVLPKNVTFWVFFWGKLSPTPLSQTKHWKRVQSFLLTERRKAYQIYVFIICWLKTTYILLPIAPNVVLVPKFFRCWFSQKIPILPILSDGHEKY